MTTAVLVLSWNGETVLPACLQSLASLDQAGAQLVCIWQERHYQYMSSFWMLLRIELRSVLKVVRVLTSQRSLWRLNS